MKSSRKHKYKVGENGGQTNRHKSTDLKSHYYHEKHIDLDDITPEIAA